LAPGSGNSAKSGFQGGPVRGTKIDELDAHTSDPILSVLGGPARYPDDSADGRNAATWGDLDLEIQNLAHLEEQIGT
jgi:hypothetical protein